MTPLAKKLHPNRFTAMSSKMAAIVAYILGEQWTQPAIAEMTTTSPDCILARHEGDYGFNDFIGAGSDLRRNFLNLLECAELTPKEKQAAVKMANDKIKGLNLCQ